MTNSAMSLTDESNPLILVPDGVAGKSLGLQAFWRLAGTLNKDALDQALLTVLPKKLLPGVSGDTKYLRRAVESVRPSRSSNLVRKLSQGKGFAMVSENREALDLEEAMLGDKDPEDAYEVGFDAKIVTHDDKSTSLKITPSDHPLAAQVRVQFEAQKGLYHVGTDISQWLTQKIIPYCNGVCGRDRGGFYYIPAGEDVARFEAIASVLRTMSSFDANGRMLNGVKVYTIAAIYSENLAEAVVDSLVEETEQLYADVETKMHEGDLGLRGWAGQRKILLNMHTKINKYAELLGVGLEDLTTKLNDLTNGIGCLEASLQYERDQADLAAATSK